MKKMTGSQSALNECGSTALVLGKNPDQIRIFKLDTDQDKNCSDPQHWSQISIFMVLFYFTFVVEKTRPDTRNYDLEFFRNTESCVDIL